MKILSLHRGPVTEIDTTGSGEWWDKPWRTGFIKQAHSGPLQLGPLGLEGDAQADLTVHGGPDKAVCIYPSEHYAFWRETLAMPDLPFAAFGENFTTEGLLEAEVCIGDVYECSRGALVQVTQPRQPCWKLARRWHVKDLAVQVERTGRTGWYFRVLQPGLVASGDGFRLAERPYPRWSLALANEIMHHRKDDTQAAGALAACPALSASWQRTLTARASGESRSSAARLNQP